MIRKLDTRFAEAKLFEPEVFEDARGYFKETYSSRKYAALGIEDRFVQDNVSRSGQRVIRGMHFDRRLSKLVQCLVGTIYDVIVDVRRESPTYLEWDGFELSERNHRQIYVPAGFAHGFLVLSPEAIVSYKQSEHFDPAHEGGVGWDDPAVGIAWPLADEPIVSEKDGKWPRLTPRQRNADSEGVNR